MKESTSSGDDNPFADPENIVVPTEVADVLCVSRNASLTLGTDSLIVLDEGLRDQREASNCCGLLPQLSKATKAIPFHNLLCAQLSEYNLTIHYADPIGSRRKRCRVARIDYRLQDKSVHAQTQAWVEVLMKRAYPPGAKRNMRIKILINPFGGQGKAQKLWSRQAEPVFMAAQCQYDVERTGYRGHAAEIAEKLDIEEYDTVICASGDGLPHEVFNGLAKRADAKRALRKVAVCQLPCGSGNAMSLNLCGTDSPSMAALEIVKGVRIPLDLMAITQGQKQYYSFLSQAAGVIAETDLGTESLRWMGSFRFTWGIVVRVLGGMIYPAEVSMVVETQDKPEIREGYRRFREELTAARVKQLDRLHEDEESVGGADTGIPPLRFGTVTDPLHPSFVTQDLPTLGTFYVGNMCYMSPDAPFFTAALPSDGKMDMVTIRGDVSRTTALRLLATIGQGTIMNSPDVNYGKVLAYRITPRKQPGADSSSWRARLGKWLGGASGRQQDGLISIDGESVPFEPFQVEIVPALGTVLSKHRAIYEFNGPA